MAASGFTPISLYYSATASAVPLAGNLVAGELALNTNDGKLYYKDSSNVVQVIATKAGANGTVTSVGGTGTVNGITLTGTVTSSGNLTLGGTLSGVNLASQVTGTLPIANGGTGATTNTAARTNLGATTLGANIFTITNPSAITFPRFNADNTVSALSAADFRTAIGAGTGGGTVTSVAATAGTGISISGSPITTSGTLTITNTAPDQVVSLTGSGATSISGTYPNFTISSTNTTYTASTGLTLSSTAFSLTAISAGDAVVGAVRYNSTTSAAGQFYGGTTNPSGTTRLNYAGNLHVTNLTAVTDVTSSSDERLKENWNALPSDLIYQLANVKSGTYDRKDINKRQVGVSAQSLQQVMPEAVMEDEAGYLSVSYGQAALAAVVELSKQVVALTAEVAELKAKLK